MVSHILEASEVAHRKELLHLEKIACSYCTYFYVEGAHDAVCIVAARLGCTFRPHSSLAAGAEAVPAAPFEE